MIIAGTGHRPDKLGGYSDEAFDNLKNIAKGALLQLKATKVISGMALGWDQALAEAAIELRIPVVAAIPFRGQESKWFPKSIQKFNEILSKCSEIVYVSEGGYHPSKMQIRNIWMVDNCDILLAMYNGDKSGGTANCIKYAESKLDKDQIVNVYDQL